MFRRTMLGMAAVLGLLVVGSGSAFAHGGFHHGHGGYGGYGGFRGYGGYGGYGYRPMVVAPVVVPPMYGGYGYGGGYGGGYGPGMMPGYGYGAYGYGSPYGAGIGYSSPGFGVYLGR